ncbi:MAG TPA: selenium metabolism-associated LysR family transcriptional regulator [Pseudoneobacillus sp.]|nr:selenium metabolism-associated LysR family transcriptional regulator [Pseudoneobacillus sp.]
MDFHQLFIFTKVVEHKSFSKAANDVFLTQSTVSSHIQSLEKTLNAPLFDRVGREIILTPTGERLYEWGLKILQLKDQALLDLQAGKTELRGVIKLAVSSVPGQFILPKMVKQFRNEYTSVTFQVNQFSSKIVADKVLNGSVDIGILGEKYENEKLIYQPLLKEKLVLISSKELKLQSPINVKDIIKYPFIMRNSGSGTNAVLEKYLKNKQTSKDQLNIVAYTDSGQSLIQFVRQGIGLSIISEIAAKEYEQNQLINIYELDDFNEERYFYLVYNVERTLSMISKLFVESAGELVSNHSYLI